MVHISIKRASVLKYLALNMFLRDRIIIKNKTDVIQHIYCLVIEKEIKIEDLAPRSFHVLNENEMSIDCVLKKLYHIKVIKPGKSLKINCKYDTLLWGKKIIQTHTAFDIITLEDSKEEEMLKC